MQNDVLNKSQVKTESTLNTLETVSTLKQILEKDHAHTAKLSWTFKKVNSIDVAQRAVGNTQVTQRMFPMYSLYAPGNAMTAF